MEEQFKDWTPAFAPLIAEGRTIRLGQAQFGQAVFDAFKTGTHLVNESPVGTGKSFGILIPMIVEILAGKKIKKPKRGVVSTETLALQTQLEKKDLPALARLYPGFIFKVLRGRSHYFCYDQGAQSAIGDKSINYIVTTLQGRIDSLGDGTKSACEKVLGREIDPKTWKRIAGSTGFCNDNTCKGDKGCFAMKARAEALVADIVVCNHAIIQTDIDMKSGGGAFSDGLLGDIDFLVIDEAHSLANVLISGWTETLSEWELMDMMNSMSKGITKSASHFPSEVMSYYAAQATEDMSDVVASFIKFYGRLNEKNNQDWAGSSTSVSLKYVVGSQDAGFQATMREYEDENPKRLTASENSIIQIQKHLEKTVAYIRDNDLKGVREISKGLRASKKLLELITTLKTAMDSKNGIVFNYGVNYGVLVDGWVKKDGSNTCTIRMIPLDISSKATAIWAQADSCVLTSGTLRDPVDNSFAYAKASLGFPEAQELVVDTPFDFHKNQLIYVTPASQRPNDDTVFAFSELLDLIHATKGGVLVLCTSKRELKIVASELRGRQMSGSLPYNLHVQEDGVDKNKLAAAFEEDTHSILVGLKSFFVGISIEGDSLRHVAFIRFPNERYNVECRMMMEIWGKKGFHNWYATKSLESFNQGKGRLIRTVTDRGLISILDIRMADTTSNVFRTAKIGIDSSGSYVTQDIEVVKQFMAQGNQ